MSPPQARTATEHDPVRRPDRRPARRRRGATAVALALVVVAAVVVGALVRRAAVHGHPSSAPTPAQSLARPRCTVSAILVPSCGRWWGAAPLAYTNTSIGQGVRIEERLAGRRLDIVHVYHRNDELFPTAAERAVAGSPGSPGRRRLLFVNWKPDTSATWRQVADGRADSRIDRLARYVRSTFTARFFLTIWHEPENDVRPAAGSGFTAADYAAMYAHVVRRLRADGVTNAVTVMDYIGYDKWAHQPWFADLWPGDAYVDWVGLDPYGSTAQTGTGARDLRSLVDQRSGDFPGYYSWATRTHPGKPVMLAEWGVRADRANPSGQAEFFATVGRELAQFPQLKALVYFDIPRPPHGQPRTDLAATARTTAAYRALGRLSVVVAPAVP